MRRRGTISRSRQSAPRVGPAVGFNEADDDVHAVAAKRVRVFEHRVGLADAGAAPM
jgi:hypothetical protein